MPNARNRAQRNSRRVVRQANTTNSARTSGLHARLSRPATDYARSVVNPFDGPICAYPDLPVIPTRKERYWVKGSAVTTAAGNGFLLFHPFSACASDLNSCFVSSATSTEVGAFPAGLTSTGVTGSKTNSVFPAASFNGQGFGMKIVSAGCRIRYTGQALKRSGTYTALHEPSHQGLNSKTAADLLAYPEGKKVSLADHKDWFGCTYMPVDIGDTKFINQYATSILKPPDKAFFTDSVEASYESYPFMGILLQTSAGESVTFDYECAVVVEVIGKNVTGKTPSLADPAGLAAVHTAVGSHPHTTIHHGVNVEEQAIQGTLNSLTHMVSTIGQGINSLSGATQSVSSLLNAAKRPSESSGGSLLDTLGTIWKGVSSVAPLIAAII